MPYLFTFFRIIFFIPLALLEVLAIYAVVLLIKALKLYLRKSS